jgi:unsaturated rhamnogalacturonyl hydrolase
MSRHEVESGAWRTVVDSTATAIESSVGAFVALGVPRAIRHGLLDPEWSPMADRAWHATRNLVSPDGLLLGVSDATPVGEDVAHYDARPRGSFPWGQGPALLAAVDRLNAEQSSPETSNG